jgi:hypothetical protein
MIAVHAEHLEAGRIAVVLEPLIELVAADRSYLLSMLITVVIDVVDSQNEWLVYSAPVANETPIGFHCFGLEPIVIGEGSFASLFRIGLFPIGIEFIDPLFIGSIIFPIVFAHGLPGFVRLALVACRDAFLAFPPIPILGWTDAKELIERLLLGAHPTFHEFLLIFHVLELHMSDHNCKGLAQDCPSAYAARRSPEFTSLSFATFAATEL